MPFTGSRRDFLLSAAAVPSQRRPTPDFQPSPPLRHRLLGRTGLRVTELGFGAETVSDVSVFERAIDAGINFFDSARFYQGGNAERILGAALKGNRQRVVLGSRTYANDPAKAAADLDTSLRELGTDYLDIWYLGQRDKPSEITPELLQVQHAAQKAGKTRFRGISTHRLHAVLEAIAKHRFDVVQIPYSFAIGTRRDPFSMEAPNLNQCLDRLKAGGVGVVATKVMAGGYRSTGQRDPNADIHARPGAHAAAIRWVLRTDRVQTTSVRMTDAEQLEENLEAMSGAFSPQDAKLLAAYTDAVSPVLCRMCGGCDDACPHGVHAADLVRSVTYADGYGDYAKGLQTFQASASPLRCAECSGCVVSCPNGVEFATQVKRAFAIFS